MSKKEWPTFRRQLDDLLAEFGNNPEAVARVVGVSGSTVRNALSNGTSTVPTQDKVARSWEAHFVQSSGDDAGVPGDDPPEELRVTEEPIFAWEVPGDVDLRNYLVIDLDGETTEITFNPRKGTAVRGLRFEFTRAAGPSVLVRGWKT